MKFKLEMDLNNAAFSDGDGAEELARILDDLAKRVATTPFPTTGEFRLRDSNGNTVGKARYVQR